MVHKESPLCIFAVDYQVTRAKGCALTAGKTPENKRAHNSTPSMNPGAILLTTEVRPYLLFVEGEEADKTSYLTAEL
jgi:hypothetical protein